MSNQNPHSILIVDDIKAHRNLIKRALTKAGIIYSVVEAESIKEAESILSTGKKFSIALIDFNLESEKGTRLVTTIRNSKNYSLLPIIVLSTSKLEKNIKDSYKFGANCYITKTADIALFTKEIIKNVKLLMNYSN